METDDPIQLTAKQWIQRMDRFPLPIDIITISGGEPILYYDIANLLNGLTDKGYIVTMFSNCRVHNTSIKPNKRLRIIGTLHHGADGNRFIESVDYYKSQGIRVDVDLMDIHLYGMNMGGGRKRGGGVKDTGRLSANNIQWKECLEYQVFNYSPEGKLFTSPGQMWYERAHGEIKKDITWQI